jgi:DNA repair protein RadC
VYGGELRMSDAEGERFRYTLKDMPEELRPRERLLREGESALSDAELLAIILRVGTSRKTALELAQHLLTKFGGLRQLRSASIDELCKVSGVGKTKAVQLKAAFELGRRAFSSAPYERPTIKSPDDVAQLLMSEMRYLDREVLRIVLLDAKNRVLGAPIVSVGTVNSSLAHPRECFKEAIRQSAVGVIFVHNHPSGDPHPSECDIELSKRLKEAGDLLGIAVLDHIIIGDGVFVSLKEMGLV